MNPQKQYWALSCDDDDRSDNNTRIGLTLNSPPEYLEGFQWLDPITIPEQTTFEATIIYPKNMAEGFPVDDFPITTQFEITIVSDRLKCILERLHPSHFRFLTVNTRNYRGKLVNITPYWVVLCLNDLDLLDQSRSFTTEPDGTRWASAQILSQSEVNRCLAPVGRLKHLEYIIVVDQLTKSSIEQHDLAGANFHSFTYSNN